VTSDATADRGIAIYRRLLGYTTPHKTVFVIAVVAMVVAAATEPWFAKIMQDILDEGFVKRDPDFISRIPLLIVALFLVRGVAGFIGNYGIRWVGRRVIFALRRDLFQRMIQLPSGFYDRQSSATLVSKLIYDVEQVDAASTSAVTTLVKDSATVIGLLGWMTWLNWRLTLVLVVVTPILAWFVNFMSSRFRRASRNIQESMGGIAHVTKEAVQAQRIVKLFGGQVYEAENFFAANNRNRQQAMKRATVAAASVPVIELVGAAALGGIVYLGALFALKDQMTVSAFVSYVTAMLLLMQATRRLTKVNESLQAGIAAARSVFELMDEPPESDHGIRSLERARGHIEYRDVSFNYGSKRKKVLENVSFTVKPGQTVALVGPSGSGKSSTAALLARFYEVESGTVTVDDINVSEIMLADLRRNIALVPQETILFDDSIRNNIAYGAGGTVDEQRLLQAAEAAHVMEFVARLPQGLDTVVGEHGTRLSGGQRQRIAIARALYKDAPILILDEATSSLDTESERQVRDAINNLIRNRSTLVIAHRLSTVEHADSIVVLKHGRVVETGTHRELLASGGEYAKLYRNQLVVEDHANADTGTA